MVFCDAFARARCGDGVIDDGEACDDGDQNSDVNPDACRTTCVAAACGDGVTDQGEGCDDGNEVDNDACRNGCIEARCGDGIAREDLAQGEQGYEACDDGNNNDDDFCSTQCALIQLALFPGVLTDVPMNVLADWTPCHTQTFDTEGTPTSFVRGNFQRCAGANLLLACRALDATTLDVVANAPTSAAYTYTGSEDTHESNGSQWYYRAGHSWGYAPLGETVSTRAPCDTGDPQDTDRLCLTQAIQGGQYLFVPGGRCGDQTFGPGEGGNYEWLIYYRDNP